MTCQFKIVLIRAKSVFVFSVRNINIIGRIFTQYTGLLRTNTAAAKRNLLTERTGLGKSVSVSLRKNGPKLIIPEFGKFSSENKLSEYLLPFNHLYQACSGRGVGGRLKKAWYGRLRVQKLTLSVLNCAHALGLSFLE